MDEDFEEYRIRARDWIRSNLETAAASRVTRGVDPTHDDIARARSLQRSLYDAGWAGIDIDTTYGGQGLSPTHAKIFASEATLHGMPNFGILGLVTFDIVLPTILAACTEAFKRRHIPRILAGEELWCQLLSEPGAGSDLAGILTRATIDGDQFIVNGTKVWSSGAALADFGLCITRTNWDVPKHEGLTWLALPLRSPGSTVRPIREINGGWEFCEVFIDDVPVDSDEVMSEVNAGWAFTHTMLVFERGAMRGTKVEVPSLPAPDLVALADERGLMSDRHIRQLVASAHVVDVVRATLANRIEESMRQSDGNGALASYVKLAKGIYDPLRARIGLEIAGEGAMSWTPGSDSAVTGINYLNGRVQSIAGGSNEMQRNGIAEKVLGLPREPSFDRGKPFRQVLLDAGRWRDR